jgi:hypothetical protein
MKKRSTSVGIAALGVIIMVVGMCEVIPMNIAFFLGAVCFALVGLLPLVVWRHDDPAHAV